MLIRGQLILESLNTAWRGVKADMIFEGCKMNQVALQTIGRHLVRDHFFSIGNDFTNNRPDLL